MVSSPLAGGTLLDASRAKLTGSREAQIRRERAQHGLATTIKRAEVIEQCLLARVRPVVGRRRRDDACPRNGHGAELAGARHTRLGGAPSDAVL
jgi:hypothetical protein